MNVENKFNQILKEARKEKLLKNEKEAIRLNLIKFIKNNQAKEFSTTNNQHWYASFTSLFNGPPTIRYASFTLASLLIVLFFGTGISFAAQKSLPGNLFYPIKTNVNEKVLSWYAKTDESKAELNIQLAKTRLEEVEKVSLKGKLSDHAKAQAESSFNKNIDNAKKYIKHIDEKNNIDVSADLNSSLEGTLNAHAKIIDGLSNDNKDEDNNNKRKKAFSKEVHSKLDGIKRERKKSETKILEKSASELELVAKNKLIEAVNIIKEVVVFIDDKKQHISENNYLSAKENISTANDLIEQGHAKFESGNYGEAFTIFQKSIRVANEAKIYVKANVNLEIDLELPKIEIQDDNHDNDEEDKEIQIQILERD